MLLSTLKKNMKATIKNINCSQELKQRFYSFGIIKGALVFVEEVSFAKNTIALFIGSTNIAIRIDEAKFIEVDVL